MTNKNTSNDPPEYPPNQTLPQGQISSAPQTNEMRPKSEDRSNDEKNQTAKLEKDIRKGEWWLIGITALGVIVSSVIGMIYYGQLKQMRKAVTAARDANGITQNALLYVQRAFIFIRTFHVGVAEDPSSHAIQAMRFVFDWENGGNTATKGMTTHISSFWFEKGIPEDFGFPDYPSGSIPFRIYVGPKATSGSEAVVVSGHDIAEVQHHHGHLYFWGWARYRDTFPGTSEHLTEFCSEIADISQSSTGTNFNTVNCPRFNCWDEECATD